MDKGTEKVIDVSGVCSADEFYDLLGTQIELPAYFGRNLDALHDVLGELPAGECLRIINTEEMAVLMPRFARALKRMSRDLPGVLSCE